MSPIQWILRCVHATRFLTSRRRIQVGTVRALMRLISARVGVDVVGVQLICWQTTAVMQSTSEQQRQQMTRTTYFNHYQWHQNKFESGGHVVPENLFQTAGPTTEKARRPYVSSCRPIRGTTSRPTQPSIPPGSVNE